MVYVQICQRLWGSVDPEDAFWIRVDMEEGEFALLQNEVEKISAERADLETRYQAGEDNSDWSSSHAFEILLFHRVYPGDSLATHNCEAVIKMINDSF